MSERLFRCPHCGRAHPASNSVCPTTGLAIDARPPRRRRFTSTHRHRAAKDGVIGLVIDRRYRLTDTLGEGGTSVVSEAEQLGRGNRVAVKILHPSLADDRETVARLRHEADLVGALEHANICPILDLGRTSEGRPYLVMPRLYGESLAQRIERGAVPLGELGPLLLQVLSALASAHSCAIVHRDLKPENIFIEHRGPTLPLTAKLLDFGVAKSFGAEASAEPRLTDTGIVMGTPYYMAPEQARGETRLDGRVDLWAMGVICYEALSARRPFFANNYNALLVQVLTAEPKPIERLVAGLPSLAGEFVNKALRKPREERFQTAEEMWHALLPIAETAALAPTREVPATCETRPGALVTTRAEAAIRRQPSSEPPFDSEPPEEPLEEATIQDVARYDYPWSEDDAEPESDLPEGFGVEHDRELPPGELDESGIEDTEVTPHGRGELPIDEEGSDTQVRRRGR